MKTYRKSKTARAAWSDSMPHARRAVAYEALDAAALPSDCRRQVYSLKQRQRGRRPGVGSSVGWVFISIRRDARWCAKGAARKRHKHQRFVLGVPSCRVLLNGLGAINSAASCRLGQAPTGVKRMMRFYRIFPALLLGTLVLGCCSRFPAKKQCAAQEAFRLLGLRARNLTKRHSMSKFGARFGAHQHH